VTATTRTALSPIGAAQQLLGQSCLNCHSQVHGSNHPWRAGSGYANAAYGTMAQAPDNQFQALSLSRVRALAGHSPDFVSTLAGAALFENDPLLRRFHVADRDRSQWQGSRTQPLGTAWSLTLQASSGQDWLPFPAVGTRSTNLLLSGEYTLPKKNKVGLRYRYVNYQSSDFALDNVAVDTLNNVLLLGNASPVFAGSIVELRFTALLP